MEIVWSKYSKGTEGYPEVNECLETKTTEEGNMTYLNMKHGNVDSFSMFYTSKEILATFCDGKIKIPTDTKIGQPTSTHIVRGMSKESIFRELGSIGKRLEGLLPYFDKVKTDVPTFQEERKIINSLVEQTIRGQVNEELLKSVWCYWK